MTDFRCDDLPPSAPVVHCFGDGLLEGLVRPTLDQLCRYLVTQTQKDLKWWINAQRSFFSPTRFVPTRTLHKQTARTVITTRLLIEGGRLVLTRSVTKRKRK